MSRYLSWLANGTLLVLSCFLVANTANAVIASWLAPTPDEVAASAAAPAAADRSWAQRQLILDRNLFKAALVTNKPPPPPVRDDENLEATTLALALIGTAASSENPSESWAAVQDQDARKHLVLKQGDRVKGKATVERIEPKRIVLRENGQLRELAMAEDGVKQPPPRARRGGSANRRSRSNRRAANVRPPAAIAPPAPVENPLASAAELFSQANLVPKFENGEMVGVQIDAIQPGSSFEAAGIKSGEIITELNGIAITSQQDSQKALAAFATGGNLNVKVRGADGDEERTIDVPVNLTN